ncbi:hypothetical protein V1504DRAFT_472212 [Lipomyces starkeyi]
MPSIHDRIREDLLIGERALWTALNSADPGPAVQKMCNPEANLMFPQMPILTLDGEPSLKEALQPPFHRFDSYALDEVRVDSVRVAVRCGIMPLGRQRGVRSRMRSGAFAAIRSR